MRKLIRQIVGIDVALLELVVCFGTKYDDLSEGTFFHATFPNTVKGFQRMLQWVTTKCDESVEVNYIMEATGVYHESLAYFLRDHNKLVSIILPNRISNFART